MFQVIDMHCDTIPALQWKEKQEHLADADLQINLDKLEKGGSMAKVPRPTASTMTQAATKAGVNTTSFLARLK